MSSVDIDHVKQWIGREQTIEDLLTADLAGKYHAMLDMPGDAPQAGDAVPRLIHFCLAQPAVPTAGLGPDGHPTRGGFLPPVPLPRRMWAGGSLRFEGDLLVGDAVRRDSRIDDVVLKQGRAGALCFVTVSHRISVNGQTRIEERQDIVYREPQGSSPTAAAPPPEPGQYTRPMTTSTPLLFRYSALTFNGHRIHYDRPYATQEEGYPGLVVHGPLQAAMLLNYAAELLGQAPRTFSFRGLSPLFDGEPFKLNATHNDDGALKLWTSKAGGKIAVSAEAS